jgi:hypothetical protein
MQPFANNTLSLFGLRATIALTVLLLISCSEEDRPSMPSIESFSPVSAEEGEEVTINGTHLSQISKVTFNGTEAPIKTKTDVAITVDVPEGASTGKIQLTYPKGILASSGSFQVLVSNVLVQVSDFEEADANTRWGTAEDAGELLVNAIEVGDAGHHFRLKGSDPNLNYWVGGRYTGTSGPTVPLGITESDPTKVWFNVDIKSNIDVSAADPHKAKLVFEVYDAVADRNTKNWEQDFNVSWTTFKTISIRADKFHRWNGNGFDAFNGNITKAWVVALYLTGGSTTVYDFSFDNVKFSQGAPLGEEINP